MIKIKKIFYTILIFTLSISLLSGCSSNESNKDISTNDNKITDMTKEDETQNENVNKEENLENTTDNEDTTPTQTDNSTKEDTQTSEDENTGVGKVNLMSEDDIKDYLKLAFNNSDTEYISINEVKFIPNEEIKNYIPAYKGSSPFGEAIYINANEYGPKEDNGNLNTFRKNDVLSSLSAANAYLSIVYFGNDSFKFIDGENRSGRVSDTDYHMISDRIFAYLIKNGYYARGMNYVKIASASSSNVGCPKIYVCINTYGQDMNDPNDDIDYTFNDKEEINTICENISQCVYDSSMVFKIEVKDNNNDVIFLSTYNDNY